MGRIVQLNDPVSTRQALAFLRDVVTSRTKGVDIYDDVCYVDRCLSFEVDDDMLGLDGYVPVLGRRIQTTIPPQPDWCGVVIRKRLSAADYWFLRASFLWRHHDALIRCAHCSMAFMAHTDAGKCLYEATTYKRHRFATHEPFAYDIISRKWVRVLEDT